jgi:hypothetical protein
MENIVSLTNGTAERVSKLAKLYGMSNSECVERLLSRFVFDTIDNEVVAKEAELIICQNRSQAELLAKRLEDFVAKNGKNNPGERLVQASPCSTAMDWVLKTVLV